ncbi:hypothetical protein, partial [Chryseobacterium koreense]|uniref:hypothetical protein n=1 Tax=Chryseobacterium koreense TaxID=232216 RepID=UPI0019D38EED
GPKCRRKATGAGVYPEALEGFNGLYLFLIYFSKESVIVNSFGSAEPPVSCLADKNESLVISRRCCLFTFVFHFSFFREWQYSKCG